MTFTDGYRVERVYFERLKSLITILKSLKDGVQDETVRTLIENAIDSDGAILLLYRNLGEAWAELADQVQKTRKMLQDLDEKTEKYHDELNERIDEVNNYLMALIRALEARMDAVEADLAQMGRLFTYDLQRVNDEYTLTESGQPVTWAGTVEKVQHVRPHFVTVRGSLDGEVTYLMPREYDTAQASGIFEWYSVGFVGNEIHEVTVTLLPDDSVNVAIHTTDFAAILQRISNLETRMTTAETDIDNLETRMTTAETDIDNLETEMDGKQDALTAGSGILLANNVISADTDVLQEKLVAGSGISIDPDTNEISASAQPYTAGTGIVITQNNEISTGYIAKASKNGNVYNEITGSNSATGTHANAFGYYTSASGDYSTAFGYGSKATSSEAFASGFKSEASGSYSFASGYQAKATGTCAFAHGDNATASGSAACSIGSGTNAYAENSLAVGKSSSALGNTSQAIGENCVARHKNEFVFGAFPLTQTPNTPTERGQYVEIVGTGVDTNNRSNGRTLDWNGNEWLSGQVQPENGIRLKDANNVYWNITIDTSGNLVITQAT